MLCVDLAPSVVTADWDNRVLKSPVPVMVHFWSNLFLYSRSKKLAPVIDDVAYEFEGKLAAVRVPGLRCRLMCKNCA